MSKEAVQIGEKRREVKDKREKERYIHLNPEFQIIAGRSKKVFLNDQYKEIEENNTMGKTRALLKKIRGPKVVFHAKMGTIKDRNSMELKKQKMLRRGSKITQKNCIKKIVMT